MGTRGGQSEAAAATSTALVVESMTEGHEPTHRRRHPNTRELWRGGTHKTTTSGNAVAFCLKAAWMCEEKMDALIKFLAQLKVKMNRSSVEGAMVVTEGLSLAATAIVSGRAIDDDLGCGRLLEVPKFKRCPCSRCA